MQMKFFFNQSRCTGCYTCVVACKDWHDIPAGPVSWIKISAIESGKYPTPSLNYLVTTCFHCAEPLCLKACPVDAIQKRSQNGIVIVDSELCIGGEACKFACKKTCPYDVPQFAVETNPKMQKCHLCAERWGVQKKPICVEACPMRALDAGPSKEIEDKYGHIQIAAGFVYSKRVKPSIIFRPKCSSQVFNSV